ncbi:MAG: hypothetical protein R3D98_09445 [Candidatus Krumholzibacteriia bacterium]
MLGALLLAGAAGAQGALEIPLSSEVQGSADQLARLRGDIRTVRAELDSLSGQRETARRSVSQVTREMGLVKELLAGLDQREVILEQQRDTLQARLAGQRETYGMRKQALGARLRALYMEGPQRDLELIITSESFSTLVARLKFNAMLARLDGSLVARTREQGRQIEAEQKHLQAALAGIWEAREEARGERERLEMLEAERLGLLREVQQEEKRVQQQLDELTRQRAGWPTSWPGSRPSASSRRSRNRRPGRTAWGPASGRAGCRGRCRGRWQASSAATCIRASARSPCTTA